MRPREFTTTHLAQALEASANTKGIMDHQRGGWAWTQRLEGGKSGSVGNSTLHNCGMKREALIVEVLLLG
jgi:hypothetical protein